MRKERKVKENREKERGREKEGRDVNGFERKVSLTYKEMLRLHTMHQSGIL